MSLDISQAIAIAAPYYNLAMVVVVVYLFVKLFRTKPVVALVDMKPWKYLFAALCIFILEEIATVLRAASVLKIDFYVNGFFELIIVSLIINGLLLQRQHILQHHVKGSQKSSR